MIFKLQTLIKFIGEILYLKTLTQALDSTSLIKAKPLEMCLPCLLVQKVGASFNGEIQISLLYCPRLISHLAIVSIDSLYSTLKVVTKPLDIN